MPAPLRQVNGTVDRALVRRVTPGAVVLIARCGKIAKWQAYGYSALYRNADRDLMKHPVRMHRNTIFDLASVTKLFTTTAIMQLWDEGKFKLDDPVAKYLPQFGVNGKETVTIRELLTHTSGLRGDPPTPLYAIHGSRAKRIKYVLGLPLEYPPGTHYVYSDINFITLGALIKRLSGEREDAYVHKHIAEPLHMDDTMYNPPARLKRRIDATEYQPSTGRGMLQGQVNDENAWALGGVAGHAGLFSSAHDLAVFGQMMLNGGRYEGARVLSRRAVKLISTNWDKKYPGDATGLGWSINRGYMMGALSGKHSIGHEGYTGTNIVINRRNGILAIILTNREHPTRHGPSVVATIREFNTDVAKAIPVAVSGSRGAWFSGYGNYLNRKLTADVGHHKKATLSFHTWYRTEKNSDYCVIQSSDDGVHWRPLARFTGTSDGWKNKTLSLPPNTRYVQFLYRTNAEINGRGWYLNQVHVKSEGQLHHPDFSTDDWTRQNH